MEQPIAQAPVAPPENKSFNPLILILAFLLVFLLGAGVMYAWQNYSQLLFPKTAPLPKIIPTPIPIPTATPSPSSQVPADWKTYINSSIGIELKYPNSWTTKEFSIGTAYPIYPVVELVSGIKPDQNKMDWPSIQIYYFENPEDLTLPQLEGKYTSSESGFGPKIYQGKGEWTKVGGVDAYRIKNGDCEPFGCDKISIPYKQKVYVIQNFLVIPENTFDQILSTFRFLP